MNKILAILLLSSILSLNSCSLVRRKPSPELGRALINVSADYIRHVVNQDEAKIGNSILWSDFLKNNEMKKPDYLKKTAKLHERFPSTLSHPLLGLTVDKIDWDENRAAIFLSKQDSDKSPTIEIKLFWGTNSWLVVDDNLFGSGELIDRWTKK